MNVSINHPTDRPNFTIVEIGSISLAFSYRTIIGFRSSWGPWRVIENQWGPTTGKHLNYLNEDKESRLPAEVFQKNLEVLFEGNRVMDGNPRTVAELVSKLQSVNDWLVDVENELVGTGDIPAFTRAHDLLNELLQVIGDFQYELDGS